MTWLDFIPWFLSAWTLGSMWAAGSSPRLGWGLALLGQIPWGAYTFVASAWGFLPLNIGLTLIYARNLHMYKPQGNLPSLPPLDAAPWELWARRLGVWPVIGPYVFRYYRAAQAQISPHHPDAPLVGRRFSRLKQEFDA